MSGEVRCETVGPVGWIIFDNPERRNALDATMIRQLAEAVERLGGDDAVRVVALRGAGEAAFVSGADISAFGSADGVDSGPRVEDVLQTLTSLAKPVLAALRGWCLGAGVMVALAADLRLAGDDLRMGIPAARLGVAYPRGGVERLVAVAGPAAAAELLMTAEPYEAQEALRRGLVDRLHPAAGLMERAQTLAEVMAEGAPLTLAAAKLAVASALHPSDTAAAEAADAAARACYASRDFQEGQRAFIEKRRPAFEGR